MIEVFLYFYSVKFQVCIVYPTSCVVSNEASLRASDLA